MKRLDRNYKIATILVVLICWAIQLTHAQVSVWNGSIAEEFGGGDGSIDQPFEIRDASQLALLAYRVNNGFGAGSGNVTDTANYYTLMVDIDLNRILWTPAGNGLTGALFAFGGFFDGNYHTIYNLRVEMVTHNQLGLGLFGYCRGATISNLSIAGNSSVTSTPAPTGGYSDGYDYVGSIMGFGESVTIYNCHNKGVVSSSAMRGNCGGIAGLVCTCTYYSNNCGFTIISNCSNTGVLSSTNSCGWLYEHNVGGIIGKNEKFNNQNSFPDLGTWIINCYNTGSVTSVSRDAYAGGISGSTGSSALKIINCYNAGTIQVSGNSNQSGGGGIIGPFANYGQLLLQNSYYLVNCGSNITNDWGVPRTEAFMKSNEFVRLLNDGSFTYCKDSNPFQNNGYPKFTGFEIYTLPATNITQSSAVLNGYIKPGNQIIDSKGFQIETDSSSYFVTADTSSLLTEFAVTIDSLQHNTTLQVRVFAVNSLNDTTFGQFEIFTTLPAGFDATVAGEVCQTTATIKVIFNLGDAVCLSKGLEYKTENDYQYKVIYLLADHDSAEVEIDSLLPGKNYQFHAFFKDKTGTYYSAEGHFSTLPGNDLHINDEAPFNDYLIYPNPAASVMHIKRSSPLPANYMVTDIFGKRLINGRLTLNDEELDVSFLPSGIYFISFTGNKKLTVRFIKD